jgi:hypothetical protein
LRYLCRDHQLLDARINVVHAHEVVAPEAAATPRSDQPVCALPPPSAERVQALVINVLEGFVADAGAAQGKAAAVDNIVGRSHHDPCEVLRIHLPAAASAEQSGEQFTARAQGTGRQAGRHGGFVTQKGSLYPL